MIFSVSFKQSRLHYISDYTQSKLSFFCKKAILEFDWMTYADNSTVLLARYFKYFTMYVTQFILLEPKFGAHTAHCTKKAANFSSLSSLLQSGGKR